MGPVWLPSHDTGTPQAWRFDLLPTFRELAGGKPGRFDMAADPMERRNVAGNHRRVIASLRGRLEAFEKTATLYQREFGVPAHISPEQAERLKALGYVQ